VTLLYRGRMNAAKQSRAPISIAIEDSARSPRASLSEKLFRCLELRRNAVDTLAGILDSRVQERLFTATLSDQKRELRFITVACVTFVRSLRNVIVIRNSASVNREQARSLYARTHYGNYYVGIARRNLCNLY